jgi:hypothetical protein
VTDREKQPDKLSRLEALKVVREISADPANILYPEHAIARMALRRVAETEVQRVLTRGSMAGEPYLATKGDWRCEMTGRTAGRVLTVALAIEWRTRLIVVTVIDETRK